MNRAEKIAALRSTAIAAAANATVSYYEAAAAGNPAIYSAALAKADAAREALDAAVGA